MFIPKTIISLLAVLSTIQLAQSKPLYDSLRTYVLLLNAKNFDSQVTNNR